MWTPLRNFLAHRHLPVFLALLAVILMLPALRAGLFMDDLVQRVFQLRPDELPPQIQQTGFGSPNSGRLGTVLTDLFGLPRGQDRLEQAKEYGIITWWMQPGLKAALWRPFTAFTHWLDYRLFPNQPMLMHAHNIAWFAAAVVLVTLAYRRIHASFSSAALESDATAPGTFWIPGLASLLFLLDKNSFFPVMYVANRGFIISLCFGLLCLLEHHQWRRGVNSNQQRRTTASAWHMYASAFCFALALLANEGGASTLAFLLAYALVLERADWKARVVSLLPAGVVLAVWRIVYVAYGFGVANLGGYIDPGYEPLLFLQRVFERITILMGAQLSCLPPELILFFSPSWKLAVVALFFVISAGGMAIFLHVIRRDRVARFWFFVMLFGLIPAATVLPLGKNMAFVAVGAFGAIAAFVASAFSSSAAGRIYRLALRSAAVCLLFAHIAGALLGRGLTAVGCQALTEATRVSCGFPQFPDLANRDAVIVNNPCLIATLAAPFTRAYYSEPVPSSIRTLLPANTGFKLSRPNPTTLVVEAAGPSSHNDIFSCDPLGPVHPCYALQTANDFLAGCSWPTHGERRSIAGFTAEVLEVTKRGAPRKVAFRFDAPLDSENLLWLRFDWPTFRYERFNPPKIGEEVQIRGPGPSRSPHHAEK